MTEVHMKRALKYTGIGLCGVISLAVFLFLELVLMLMIYFTSNAFQYPGGTLGVVAFTYIVTVLLIPVCVAPCFYYSRRTRGEEAAEVAVMKPEADKVGSLEANDDGVLEQIWMKRRTVLAVLILGFLLVFFFLEITLMFYSPVDSVFPLEPVSADAFAESSFKPSGCNVEQVFADTKTFFANSSVDFTNVRVVYGGLPMHLNVADAQVIGNAVYMRADYCPTLDIMIHEVAHVWQTQQGIWLGAFGSTYFRWMIDGLSCRSCPYDYGFVPGLTKAVAENRKLRSFGIEQQAEIVTDYFRLLDAGSFSDPLLPLTKLFSDEMLQDAL